MNTGRKSLKETVYFQIAGSVLYLDMGGGYLGDHFIITNYIVHYVLYIFLYFCYISNFFSILKIEPCPL